MKKKTLILIIVGVILLLVLISSVMKNVYFVPCFYKNNNLLTAEENKEIKSLLLNVMKNRHSTVFSMDEKEKYIAKSFWVNINYDFMDSVEKKDDNKYTAKIQMQSPDDWCYYFTIRIDDGKYIVSDFGIDP